MNFPPLIVEALLIILCFVLLIISWKITGNYSSQINVMEEQPVICH